MDQITEFRNIDEVYCPCDKNLETYFEQRIGASSSFEYREPVNITFQADSTVQKALEAAPLHPSQHIIETLPDGSAIMEITVIYTREMLFELCKYCEGLTVLGPIDLRYSVARYHAEALDNYGYPVDYELFNKLLNDNL